MLVSRFSFSSLGRQASGAVAGGVEALSKRFKTDFAGAPELEAPVRAVARQDPLFAKDLQHLEQSSQTFRFRSFSDPGLPQRFEWRDLSVNLNPRKHNFLEGMKHEVFHAVQHDAIAEGKVPVDLTAQHARAARIEARARGPDGDLHPEFSRQNLFGVMKRNRLRSLADQAFASPPDRMLMEAGALATGKHSPGVSAQTLRADTASHWQAYESEPGYDTRESARARAADAIHAPTVERLRELGVADLLAPESKGQKR